MSNISLFAPPVAALIIEFLMYSCIYIKNSISFRAALLSDCWLLTNPSKIPFTPNQLSKMSCFLLFTELKRRQVALMPHCPTGTSRPALEKRQLSCGEELLVKTTFVFWRFFLRIPVYCIRITPPNPRGSDNTGKYCPRPVGPRAIFFRIVTSSWIGGCNTDIMSYPYQPISGMQ